MEFTEVLLLLITLTLAIDGSSSSGKANRNFTLPSNCPKACGDIKIEYPFGIGNGCFYAAGFNLTCSYDFNPPRLFLRDTTRIRVVDFDMDSGLIQIESPYVVLNVDEESMNVTLIDFTNLPFSISPQVYSDGSGINSAGGNNLYVGGCNATASIVNPITNSIVRACSSICSSTIAYSFTDQNGYCQISFDSLEFNKTSIILQLYRPNENENNQSMNSGRSSIISILCGAYCPSNKGEFQSSMKRENKSRAEASLSWHISDRSSCEEARNHSATYACRSFNSDCYDTAVYSPNYDIISRTGYLCQCSLGYHGNPYLPDGCQLTDVDECKSSSSNNCKGNCMNTEGSFNCACPPGTSKDPLHGACIPNKKKLLLLGVLLGASIGIGLLLLCITLVILSKKWNRRKLQKIRQRNFHHNHGLLLQQLISTDEHVENKTNIFSLDEIEKATNNFDETRVIGRGGHGTVYKGILSDQKVVAVKKSKIDKKNEIDQFINEVVVLSQINHRNIVKLFGCCLETEVPLLIYEFMSNGNLSDHIHVLQGESKLSWDDRLRIAMESAEALAYLHSYASISIFHRDIKSSNILLDDNFKAKISDFGTSRFIPLDQTHIVTGVQGTFGYLDPEYYQTGQLTEKSDVYSFGIILLELLMEKKPIYLTKTGSPQNLAMNFLQMTREKMSFDLIKDHILQGGTEQEFLEIISLIKMCLSLKGVQRPTMKEVEQRLQGMRKIKMKKMRHHIPNRDEETKRLHTLSSDFPSGSANQINQENSRNYSLEKEFMWSQNYPR